MGSVRPAVRVPGRAAAVSSPNIHTYHGLVNKMACLVFPGQNLITKTKGKAEDNFSRSSLGPKLFVYLFNLLPYLVDVVIIFMAVNNFLYSVLLRKEGRARGGLRYHVNFRVHMLQLRF